jgi:hypothetical protein
VIFNHISIIFIGLIEQKRSHPCNLKNKIWGICVSNAFPAPIIVIIINMAFSCQVRNFLKKKHQTVEEQTRKNSNFPEQIFQP